MSKIFSVYRIVGDGLESVGIFHHSKMQKRFYDKARFVVYEYAG